MFGFLFFSFLLFSDSIQDDSESATVGLILAFWLSFSHPVFLVSLRTRQLRIKVRTNAHTGGRLITKTNKKLIDWVLITAAGRSIVLLLLLLVECQNQSSSLLVLFYEEKKLPACLLISIPFFSFFTFISYLLSSYLSLSLCWLLGCWQSHLIEESLRPDSFDLDCCCFSNLNGAPSDCWLMSSGRTTSPFLSSLSLRLLLLLLVYNKVTTIPQRGSIKEFLNVAGLAASGWSSTLFPPSFFSYFIPFGFVCSCCVDRVFKLNK